MTLDHCSFVYGLGVFCTYQCSFLDFFLGRYSQGRYPQEAVVAVARLFRYGESIMSGGRLCDGCVMKAFFAFETLRSTSCSMREYRLDRSDFVSVNDFARFGNGR